ncbi:pyridoxal phosphate-dependent aminotransferase [Bradyrhizobium sp. UFLA05-109]
MTAGKIWSELAPSVREGAIAPIDGNLNRHTDAIGLLELRHACACKVSAETTQPWSADEIAVTSGAKQALSNAAMALLNPGDEVLIPVPYRTNFPKQIIIAGGAPIFVETRHNSYVPMPTDLAAAITSRTKAIVVNTPNNPTGTVYDRDIFAGIAQLARERNLWIIFGECYGAFAHPPHAHHPILPVAPRPTLLSVRLRRYKPIQHRIPMSLRSMRCCIISSPAIQPSNWNCGATLRTREHSDSRSFQS